MFRKRDKSSKGHLKDAFSEGRTEGEGDNKSPAYDEMARLHSAGAIVRQRSPFSDLPVPFNDPELSEELVVKWVVPFYMQPLEPQRSDFIEACVKATPELTLSLLGEFNWRPRVVGARFIAVRQFSELQQEISNLLLRSDVCYAGSEYCLALASLGNESAADTLFAYLDYYLRRLDLHFDQGAAMSALLYLDESLGSSRAASLQGLWRHFIGDKSHHLLEHCNERFRRSVAGIEGIRRSVAASM